MELYQPQLQYGGKVYHPGVYDISNEEYHASAGISRSGLCEFKSSPLDYWDKYINPLKEKKESTKDMRIGNALHTLVLEPDLFEKEYIIKEKIDGRTTEGKAYNKKFEVCSSRKIVIEIDWLTQINNMVLAVKEHLTVAKLLNGALIEKSIYWIDSETELLCKARPDIWVGSKLADLKTTDDVSIVSFDRSVKTYNYHIQAAMQIDAIYELTGKIIEHFIFIAVPKSRPYKPYLYRCPDGYITQGRNEYKNLLKLARACFDMNKWDLDREQVIELPGRAFSNVTQIETFLEVYGCQMN